MSTILDCIKRIPSVLERIIKEWPNNENCFNRLLEAKLSTLDEIVMVGSGTS